MGQELGNLIAVGDTLTPCDFYKLFSCRFVYLWGQWEQLWVPGLAQLYPALLLAQSPTSI